MYNSIIEVVKIVEEYICLPQADKDPDRPLRVVLSGHFSDDMSQRYFYASEAEYRSDYADYTVGYVYPTDGWEKMYEMLDYMAGIANNMFKYELGMEED